MFSPWDGLRIYMSIAMVLSLTRLGILTPSLQHFMRRYAYLLLVIISVLISPPDLVFRLMVALFINRII